VCFDAIDPELPTGASRKCKGKVVSVHNMNSYRGSRVITPLILGLGAGWS